MNKIISGIMAALVLTGFQSFAQHQEPMIQKVQVVQNSTFHEVKPLPEIKKNKDRKIKNIIFLIGDGMGMSQIYAGMTANKGQLNLQNCPVTGISRTNASNAYITDSAAGATAFSIGQKTYNGAIGLDSLGRPVKTILEIAEANGLSTGMVATSSVTHATPASFIAHQKDRSMEMEIAADFLKTDIDVFIGGGRQFFAQRPDGQDLIKALKNKGYTVLENIDEIAKVNKGKLAGLTAANGNPRYSEGRGDMLLKASKTAINILDQNDKGFFLMIEGSQIDWGCHENNAKYEVDEMLDFDRVIGAVLEFAARDGETLVVITADHETGGLALNGGNIQTGMIEAVFTTTHHTSIPVPVFAYGPGSELFTGMYHNTAIYDKFVKLFGFGKK